MTSFVIVVTFKGFLTDASESFQSNVRGVGVELRISSKDDKKQELADAVESSAGFSYRQNRAIDSGEPLESGKKMPFLGSDIERSPVTDGIYAAFLALIVARLWIVPLRDGFWIDETEIGRAHV